jgi:hypothetical protein
MEIKVVRSVFNPKSTLGKLYLDGKFFAYTCEDTDRNMNGDCRKKVQDKTAIDPGRYRVVLSYSNRFKKYLPELLEVPCFKYIRIHGGNTAENSEGCILIGAESDMQNRIWNCASKVNGLVAKMKEAERKEKIYIEVVKG